MAYTKRIFLVYDIHKSKWWLIKMNKKSILSYLDNIFDLREFDDKSNNGLQIEGSKEINKIGFAVDACLDTIKKANESNCDMLICHHGIFWPTIGPIKGSNKKRIKEIIDSNLNLVAIHLPLDAHPQIGNNTIISKLFNGEVIEPLAKVGCVFVINNPISIDNAKSILDSNLDTNSKKYDLGEKEIKKIGVVSGSGSFACEEAYELNCDLLISGEFKLSDYHIANELGLNIISAGHYATETTGIKALCNKMTAELDIECIFIENKIDL